MERRSLAVGELEGRARGAESPRSEDGAGWPPFDEGRHERAAVVRDEWRARVTRVRALGSHEPRSHHLDDLHGGPCSWIADEQRVAAAREHRIVRVAEVRADANAPLDLARGPEHDELEHGALEGLVHPSQEGETAPMRDERARAD